jgi:CPA1 family monovalent cation:H+ antiporter
MLAMIAAQRQALLQARTDGTFSAEVLESALRSLDADQISLELRGSRGDA